MNEVNHHIDEHKFLTENFVSGCSLWRIESTRTDIADCLEDEYKQATVVYTGNSTYFDVNIEAEKSVFCYLAVVPEESTLKRILRAYGWMGHEVDEAVHDENHYHFIYKDMPTQTFWEHAVRQL